MRLDAASLGELGPLLASLIIACHATMPHCPHELLARFDGQLDAHELEHELVIRCLHPGCSDAETTRTHCPRELVAALTILHHTAHEGHPLELRYGNRTWRSPEVPQRTAVTDAAAKLPRLRGA